MTTRVPTNGPGDGPLNVGPSPPAPSRPLTYVDLLARLDRARSAGVLLGLDRTRDVLRRLGDPQRRTVTVHIAGTNGKGSTAAMTSAILFAGGWRVGLYTSPHLSRFTERIRVDGREANGDRLAVLEREIAATGVPLTYFEIATVLAFMTFAEAGVQIAVVETGLGGRLDATTTCDPVATAITSIAWDHADLLGPTLAAIAAEKAGIAKAGVPLFLAPVPAEADAAIAAIAARVGAPLLRLGVDFSAPAAITSGTLALLGRHQLTNAALAVALAQVAARAGASARGATIKAPLTTHAIAAGLRDVRWPGRLEWLAEDVLVDCAHNTEGATALAAVLDTMPRGQARALVFSVVAGKPADEMLRVLAPRFDAIIVTRSSNLRSIDPQALRTLAVNVAGADRDALTVSDDPLQALAAARRRVGNKGLVVGAGSTFLVGDLRAAMLGESRDPLPTSDPISVVPA